MIRDTEPIRQELARFNKLLDVYQRVVWKDYKTSTDKQKSDVERQLVQTARELSISLLKMSEQR